MPENGTTADAGRTPQRRWPAYAMAVLSLGYAFGKAVYAAQGKLGFPTGPVVPAEEYESYARDLMDVSLSQWLGATTGLLGAVLSLATVTAAGRRVPRKLMLVCLAAMVVGVGAGAAVLVLDGFIGLGVGWKWFHGVVGSATLALLIAMVWTYVGHNVSHGRTAGREGQLRRLPRQPT